MSPDRPCSILQFSYKGALTRQTRIQINEHIPVCHKTLGPSQVYSNPRLEYISR